jgi:deoxyribonuclease-4
MTRGLASGRPLLGCHLSIARGFVGAIDEADALGNNALQIFTHNAAAWRMKPITSDRAAEFLGRLESSSIEFVVAHTMYLLNLASPDEALLERSVEALIEEIRRAGLLKLDAVVTHLGAHVGDGLDRGVSRIVRALHRVREAGVFAEATGVRVLLENTAGSGTTIGSTFAELAKILVELGDDDRFSVCLDTAHAFAAGYDLRTERAVDEVLEAFDRTIGIGRLGLIHLNDSKYACGSRRDRHEHIGWGLIGRDGLGALVRHPSVRDLPVILETPKKVDGRDDADRMNLAAVRLMLEERAHEQEEP